MRRHNKQAAGRWHFGSCLHNAGQILIREQTNVSFKFPTTLVYNLTFSSILNVDRFSLSLAAEGKDTVSFFYSFVFV